MLDSFFEVSAWYFLGSEFVADVLVVVGLRRDSMRLWFEEDESLSRARTCMIWYGKVWYRIEEYRKSATAMGAEYARQQERYMCVASRKKETGGNIYIKLEEKRRTAIIENYRRRHCG